MTDIPEQYVPCRGEICQSDTNEVIRNDEVDDREYRKIQGSAANEKNDRKNRR